MSIFKRRFNIPGAKSARHVLRSLSPTEALIFAILFIVLVITVLFSIFKIGYELTERVPVHGGSFTEGIVGVPRFINPVLDSSRADKDMTTLLFAGLTKKTSDGKIEKNLAESFDISEDGTVYTFRLKDDISFHDGHPVTADDVVFTIETIQDNSVRSNKRANWVGVEVQKIDDKTVAFYLPEPFSSFLANTTVGILPKHLWGNIPTEQFPFVTHNIEPVGAGPYKISNIVRDEAGIVRAYSLSSFDDYSLGKPYIENINLRFFENEEVLSESLERGGIDAVSGISPEKGKEALDKGERVESIPQKRVFGVFFNQNQNNIFARQAIREILDKGVSKEQVVSEVLYGFGEVRETPLPPHLLEGQSSIIKKTLSDDDRNLDKEEVQEILLDEGWTKDTETGSWTKEFDNDIKELSFTLTTSNVPELIEVARSLKKQWEDLGFKVELSFKDSETLNQEIIRPREYEALLFGQVVMRPLDLFSFWHSSQRIDPGFNISLYTNKDVDETLENFRRDLSPGIERKLITDFITEIKNEVPAVFLYSPELIYVMPKEIKGFNMLALEEPSDRYADVSSWYIETNRQWQAFINK